METVIFRGWKKPSWAGCGRKELTCEELLLKLQMKGTGGRDNTPCTVRLQNGDCKQCSTVQRPWDIRDEKDKAGDDIPLVSELTQRDWSLAVMVHPTNVLFSPFADTKATKANYS